MWILCFFLRPQTFPTTEQIKTTSARDKIFGPLVKAQKNPKKLEQKKHQTPVCGGCVL